MGNPSCTPRKWGALRRYPLVGAPARKIFQAGAAEPWGEIGYPPPLPQIGACMRNQSTPGWFHGRIDEMSNQLESARLALAERNVIERAKSLLMKGRRLSEKEAYALIRETAMNQNKRVFEIAEGILSTAEILKA